MKPMHGEVKRLNRCPCCQTKYSSGSMRKDNMGKTIARRNAKREIKKFLAEGV